MNEHCIALDGPVDFAQQERPAGRSNFSYEKTSAPFFENFFLRLCTSGKKKKRCLNCARSEEVTSKIRKHSAGQGVRRTEIFSVVVLYEIVF